MTLKDKHILIGVTGSIAAYKAAILVRLLAKEGAQVRIVMSAAAKDFITPLTLATLSKHPILIDNFDPANGAWNSHVSLGEWADLYLIAPATANTLAKMATGIADNLLLCTYLSARCPVAVAPAMDLDMYAHTVTRQNIETLRDRGIEIIEPGSGELASGLSGKGRMAEPETILESVICRFTERPALKGKKFLLTAGATVEAIDPVRFVSNYSSGKMGYALADELARSGARVTLVSGAATATLKNEHVRLIRVQSAREMLDVCRKHFPSNDGAIFCAAVADYAPSCPAGEKIKRRKGEDGERITLELVQNPDIAAQMGEIKRGDQITIGFALETDSKMAADYAREKLIRKNLDAIVLNNLSDAGAGFATDTNKITIIGPEKALEYDLKDKAKVAADIADYICHSLLR